MILQSENSKLRRIKIRIDGPDKKGKNTCRQISVLDTDIDSVYNFLVSKLSEETKQQKSQRVSILGGTER